MTKTPENIGSTQEAILKTLDREPARSVHEIAERFNRAPQYIYQSVDRLVNRKLLKFDPDHPKTNPKGKGAVLLTNRGKEIVNKIR